MKTVMCVLFVCGLVGCSSSQKRGVASTQQTTCMEKTTKKQCTIDIYGDRHCTCVPDEGEMYRSYP